MVQEVDFNVTGEQQKNDQQNEENVLCNGMEESCPNSEQLSETSATDPCGHSNETIVSQYFIKPCFVRIEKLKYHPLSGGCEGCELSSSTSETLDTVDKLNSKENISNIDTTTEKAQTSPYFATTAAKVWNRCKKSKSIKVGVKKVKRGFKKGRTFSRLKSNNSKKSSNKHEPVEVYASYSDVCERTRSKTARTANARTSCNIHDKSIVSPSVKIKKEGKNIFEELDSASDEVCTQTTSFETEPKVAVNDILIKKEVIEENDATITQHLNEQNEEDISNDGVCSSAIKLTEKRNSGMDSILARRLSVSLHKLFDIRKACDSYAKRKLANSCHVTNLGSPKLEFEKIDTSSSSTLTSNNLSLKPVKVVIEPLNFEKHSLEASALPESCQSTPSQRAQNTLQNEHHQTEGFNYKKRRCVPKKSQKFVSSPYFKNVDNKDGLIVTLKKLKGINNFL